MQLLEKEIVIKTHGYPNCSPLTKAVDKSLRQTLAISSKLSNKILEMPGMSGRQYRRFINNLVYNVLSPSYLEVGSWKGSTACSALFQNKLRAICIDNWSEFGGTKEEFLEHLNQVLSSDIKFKLIEKDFRLVDYVNLPHLKNNIFFFDGPHFYQDQYDGIVLSQPALDDEYVLIVDDWNWPQVRLGTYDAIRKCDLYIDYSIEVRTTLDDTYPDGLVQQNSLWHNGYYVAVCRKQ